VRGSALLTDNLESYHVSGRRRANYVDQTFDRARTTRHGHMDAFIGSGINYGMRRTIGQILK